MTEMMYSRKRFYLLSVSFFIFFGILIAITTSIVNYKLASKQNIEQINLRASSELSYKKLYLEDYITHKELVVTILARHLLLNDFITSEGVDERARVNSFFQSVVFANPDIMQLRFINSNGLERIRVDRIDNEIFTYPQIYLQSKYDRYYFQESNQLNKTQLWHSRIDLNIEHGKIELPYKPTYRIAAPVVVNGEHKGIVIVNLPMQRVIDLLTESANFSTYLIDNEGEIISASDASLAWSKYLKSDIKINNIFPGAFNNDMNQSSLQKSNLFVYSLNQIFDNGEGVKLIMKPKASMLHQIKKNNLISAQIVALVILLISFPLSWVASYAPSKLQSSLLKAFDKIRRFNFIIDSNIATTEIDLKGNFTAVSAKYAEMTGYNHTELIGNTHSLIRHPDTTQKQLDDLWKTILKKEIWQGEFKNINKDGELFWTKQTATPAIDDKGNVTGYTAVIHNITEKKKIEELSITDRLTGLYNRHKLDAVLKAERIRNERHNTRFCAAILDADHFKRVNDTYGHQVGDDVLVKLAAIIKENTRESDFCGRWGGEEFLVVALETDITNTAFLADKLRKAVEETDFTPVEKVTVSIGVAEYSRGETIAHFINRADEALYKAKQTGRNRVVSA